MMKFKRLIAGFSFFVLLISFCFLGITEKEPEKWRNQADHSRWTNAMIFGNPSYASTKPQEIRKAVELLDDALLLCIDQYNGSYADKLNKLKEAGIPGLPIDISAIDFSAGTDHRIYTHRGWYHTYTDSELKKGHADERKRILKTVVDHVFHFGKYTDSAEAADKKCEAMCCLLYVTHIIGDRYHSAKYYGAFSTLLLAEETESVIHDLEICLPTLITEGKSSTLIRKLKGISKELIRKRKKNNTNEKLLELDKKYASQVKKLLNKSLYELLIKQPWFSAVFKPQWSSN